MTDPIRLRYRIRDRIPRTNGRTNGEGSNYMRTDDAFVTRTKGSTNGGDSTRPGARMTCIVCQTAEAADGRTVCDGCLARVDHDLERIAELTRHAADRLIPETRPGTGGRTVPASRPPLDVAALDDACGHDVLPVLEDWERAVRAHYGLAPLGVVTEPSMSVPVSRLDAGGPGDAATSRGLDTATEER